MAATMESQHDDRPIALRRKRRLSSTYRQTSDPLPSPNPLTSSTTSNVVKPDHAASSSRHLTKTPTKPKKRVRFSDPGPDGVGSVFESVSTGITPFLERTILVPSSTEEEAPGFTSTPSHIRMKKIPRQRLSLPNLRRPSYASLSPPLLTPSSPSPTPLSGEIQFAPLRQVLGERTKRRLRRNNLSEEMNDIDAEKKEAVKEEKHVRQASVIQRDEDALARQLQTEVHEAVERDHSSSVDIQDDTFGADSEETALEMPADDDEFGMVHLSDSSLDCVTTSTLSVPTEPLALPPAPRTIETMSIATQASLPSPTSLRLQSLLDTQTTHLLYARLELEHLCPGETTLGLEISNHDGSQILSALLDRIRALRAEVLVYEHNLTAKTDQEGNLRTQFNAALQQLERARQYGEGLVERNLKLEKKVRDAEGQIADLEDEVKDREVSREKLREALNSYRAEVKSLEDLVERLERDGQEDARKGKEEMDAKIQRVKDDMDEAVADLECAVVAETKGRREAEAVIDERDLRIMELERYAEELKAMVRDKQTLVREFENEVESRDELIGRLNVRVSGLVGEVDSIKENVHTLDGERVWLVSMIDQERYEGERAVEGVRGELARVLDQIERMRGGYLEGSKRRGEEVVVKRGLMTPVVEQGRFRDVSADGGMSVEGKVDIKRGKRAVVRDSGIGMMKEDMIAEERDDERYEEVQPFEDEDISMEL